MSGLEPTFLAGGFVFAEGPRWYDGKLWLSDMHGEAIHTVGLDGTVEVVHQVPGRKPSGLGFTPDGDLLFVSMLERRISRLGADGETLHADLSSFTDEK